MWKTTCTITTTTTNCTTVDTTTTCLTKNWTTTCNIGAPQTTCTVKRPDTTCVAGAWASEVDTHTHEYDDKFDVTGVNMLNGSIAGTNLGNVIKSTAVKFKVLVVNATLSPAAKLSIGGNPYIKVIDYDNQAVVDSLGNASVLTYTIADINSLMVNLPLLAFESRDWGTGVVRAGLIPTQTGCVKGAYDAAKQDGILGTWRNGALTFQIIKYNTPAANVELNVAGDLRYGYRVKKTSRDASLIAEYTIFWHHENGMCSDVAGWVVNPPEDTAISTTAASTPSPGAADPNDGSFTARPADDIESVVTTIVENVTTTVITYVGGDLRTTTVTRNSDNTITITIETVTGGVTDSTTTTTENSDGSVNLTGLEADSVGSGRISWQEI